MSKNKAPKLKKPSWWEEFKTFAVKGNAMALAVGTIIGGAFSTITKSLTDDIIMPIIAINLIFTFGGIMSVGYEKAFLMQNQRNMDVSELISTYVYKQGIRNGNPSFGSAVGLLNNVINTVLVFVVNWVTNLLTDNEMGLF